MRDYQFVQAERENNRSILELIARNPVDGGGKYYKDRSPDYFRLLDLLEGSRSYLVLDQAKKGGEPARRILGMLTALLLKGRIGQDVLPYLYLTDLLRDQSSGSLGVIRDLFYQGYTEDFVKHTAGFFGMVNEKNLRAVSVATSGKLPEKAQEIARMTMREMIPLRKRRIPRRYSIASPRNRQELREALTFINEFYGNYFLYQSLTADDYLNMCKQWPGHSLRNLILLREEGKIKAAMHYYDPEDLVRLRVVSYEGKVKKIVSLMDTLYRLTGWPLKPPGPGDAMKKLVIRRFAWTGKSGKYLLAHLNNIARENGHHSISTIYDNRVPLPFKVGMSLNFPMVFYGVLQGGHLKQIKGKEPVYFDLTLA